MTATYRLISRVDGYPAYEVWWGGTLIGYVTERGRPTLEVKIFST